VWPHTSDGRWLEMDGEDDEQEQDTEKTRELTEDELNHVSGGIIAVLDRPLQ